MMRKVVIIICLALLVLETHAQTTENSENGSIGGWLKSSDGNEVPSNVEIVLWKYPDNWPVTSDKRERISASSFAPSDTFLFTNLPLGHYGVTARCATHAGLRYMIIDNRRPIVTVELELHPAMNISGEIQDSKGNAIGGADVYIHASGTDANRLGPIIPTESRLLYTRSDSDGAFEFDFVKGGQPETYYQLIAIAEDFAPKLSGAIVPGASDIVIRPEKGSSLSGTVIENSSGKPLSGIEVWTYNVSSLVVHRAVTSDNGSFVLKNLSDHKYRLRIRDPIWSVAQKTRDVVIRGENRLDGHVVYAEDVRDPDSQFETPGLSGAPNDTTETNIDNQTKKGLSIHGRILTDSGKPITHAMIHSVKRRDDRVYTDSEGKFSLHGLEPNSTAIYRCLALGFGREMLNVDLATDSIDDIEIEMQPQARIDGVLLNPDGTPYPMERIGADFHWEDGRLERISADFTDDLGRFRLVGLPEGTYSIRRYLGQGATTEGTGYQTLLWVKLKTGAQLSEVKLVANKPFSSITGRVVDESGAPIKGAVVGAYDEVTVTTNSLGRYTLVVEPSRLNRISIRAEGYKETTLDRIISGDEAKDAVLIRDSTTVP